MRRFMWIKQGVMAAVVSSLTFSTASAYVFDWNSTGWQDGDTSGSYSDVNGSGVDITVQMTGDTDRFKDNYPALNDDDGNLNNDHLEEDVDYTDNTESVTTTFTFSVPVKLSSLVWRDIDAMDQNSFWSNTLFDDKVIIRAKDVDGNIIYPNNPQLGSNIQDDDNGTYEAKDNNKNYTPEDAEATLQVDIDSVYVTEFSYTYASGDNIGDNDDPTTQAVWFDNFNFEPKDTDGDGVPDFKDLDDDNDGILDSVEIQGNGTCAYGFFHVVNGQLNVFDPEFGTYVPVGKKNAMIYNGLGYDKADGMLYANARDDGTDDYGNSVSKGDLVEIDRYSGKIKKLSNTLNTYAADFYDGKLYGRTALKEITVWDKATDSKSTIDLDTNTNWSDFSIFPKSDGTPMAYGLYSSSTTSGDTDNTDFYQVNLDDGSVTVKKLTVSTPDGNDLGSAWGATFMAKNDDGTYHFYASNNNGYVYEIVDFNTSSPSVAFFYRSDLTGKNDGASCRDANQFPADTDGDGIPDYHDLDSDNDGIPDNVEAQTTADYQALSGVDDDHDGLDDAYDQNTSGVESSVGIVPIDTDNDGDYVADFLDSDSDNDGISDCKEGISDDTAGKVCPATLGSGDTNGLVDWAEESGNDQNYTDVNGIVDDPSSDLKNETGNTDEVAFREILCGQAKRDLIEYHWVVVSVPCDTGDATIVDLFGSSLGEYGDDKHWVMYKQIDYTGSNSNDMELMAEDDTLEVGKGYWLITDSNVTLELNTSVSGIAKTGTDDKSNYDNVGVNDSSFDSVVAKTLPDSQSDRKTKIMLGNPFVRGIHSARLYYINDDYSSYYDFTNSDKLDDYVERVLYMHDSADLGAGSGGNDGEYIAVVPDTPGFGDIIAPMYGYWMLIKEDNGTTVTGNKITMPFEKK
ncbi:Calcium-binding protein [hydrothermal vent metagenome]|uniref:Calcium-binding protein n=1 Tax=hydrothermal vent metagenome TaxID=652676 RepID=A0A1W1E856_9ZZZZ